MGNQQVASVFKEFRKKGEKNAMSLTAEALLLDAQMLQPLYIEFSENAYLNSHQEELKGLFRTNIPEPKFADGESHERLLANKYLAELNQLYSSGFKTPEATIEDLKTPSHVRYFNVYKDERGGAEGTHELMTRRSILLLILYHMRQHSSSAAKQSFTEFLRKHLNSASDGDESSHQANAAIQSSLGFVVTLMREMQNLPGCGDMLIRTLEHVNLTMKRVEQGSFFKVHNRTAFILDASLNDARTFLVDLLRQQKGQNQRLVTLALKVILTMATVRNSIEDVLTVCSLLDDETVVKGPIDLREEIHRLQASSDQADKDGAEQDNFDPDIPDEFDDTNSREQRLSLTPQDGAFCVLSERSSWIVDGDTLYGIVEGTQLAKVALTRLGGMPGRVLRTNSDLKTEDSSSSKATLLHMNDKLYLRHEGAKPAPFSYVDKATLQVTKLTEEEIESKFPKAVVPEAVEGEEVKQPDPTLRWEDQPEDGGRGLTSAPMFTDGRYLYTIARYTPTSKEQEEAGEDETLQTKLVCESYDPENNFKFVRSFVLYKNHANDLLVKESNSVSYVERCRWATNGAYLMMFSPDRKMRFFNMKSGVKVSKNHWLNDLPSSEVQTYYSPERNSFFSLYARNCFVTLFPWGVDELKKAQRDGAEATGLLTEAREKMFKKNEGAQAVPNVIQQLMQGLTTQDVANRTDDQFVPIDPSFLPNSAQLQRAFILRALRPDVADFGVAAQSVMHDSKAAAKEKLKIFRYPKVTYMTSTTFREIGSGIKAIGGMFTKGNVDELQVQTSTDFLRVASANFAALSICQLTLGDLFTNETEYKTFMDSFEQFTGLFSQPESVKAKVKAGVDAAQTAELTEVATQVIGNAISLIHRSADDVLARLQQRLGEDVKRCKDDYLYLEFVSHPQRLKGLLGHDKLNLPGGQAPDAEVLAKINKQQANVLAVFKMVTKYLGEEAKAQVTAATVDKADEPELVLNEPEEAAIAAAQHFATNVAHQMLARYGDLCEQLARRRKSSRQSAASQKAKEDLSNFSKLACELVVASYQPTIDAMAAAIENVQQFCVAKAAGGDDAWGEEVEKKYKVHSERVALILARFDAYESLITVYATSLLLIPLMDGELSRIIVHKSSSLLTVLSKWFAVQKKYGEKLGIGVEYEEESNKVSHKLEAIVSRIRTGLAWNLGHHAQSLVRVSPKDDKKEKEEEADEQTKKVKQEKERKLAVANAMQSNLLSGGVGYDNIGILKAETKEQLRKFAALGEDKELLKILDKDSNVETPFQRIIEAGKDEDCDKAITYLQKYLLKFAHKAPYARIGGDDGMRLSRAAFAVMIKFSDLSDDFDNFVDEVAMQMDDHDGKPANEVDAAMIKFVQQSEWSTILNRWSSASRMRQWIQEKKLEYNEQHEADLIAKLKKSKADALKKQKEEEEKAKKEAEAKEAEEKKDGAEEKKDGGKDEKPAEEGQIDTSAKEKGDDDKEKKDADKEKEGDDKKADEGVDEKQLQLTDEEKSKCNDEAFDLSNRDLQIAYTKLIEKAVFLTKLNLPLRFKKSGKRMNEALTLVPTKSAVEKPDGKVQRQPSQIGEGHLTWENRLKRWKDYQRSQGSIQTNQERKTAIWNSGVTSVLALLQTEIQAEKLQELAEKLLLDGAKRVAGLKLLKVLTSGEMPGSQLSAGVAWFTTALRMGTNKLAHYLDDVRGQGLALEALSREHFFAILRNVVMRLRDSKDEDEIRQLIDALKWRYTATDHEGLFSLNLFAVLHRGNGEWDNTIKKSWGRAAGGMILKKEHEQSIQETAYNVFEMVFMQVAARISESDEGQDLQLKSRTMSVAPKMQKSKSVVDEAVSERLIGQSFDVIFRELGRYVKLLSAFEGIDWETFARVRNEDRRKSDNNNCKSLQRTEQEKLLDQIDDELEKEEAESKEDEDKADGEKKEEEKPAEAEAEKKEDEPEEKKEGEADSELTEEQKKEQEDKRKEEEEKKKAELEEARKKFDEDIIADQKARAEQEIEKAKLLYQESQLLRILSLVEIFSNIGNKAPNALAMVQKVATPSHMCKLLALLLGASPTVKAIVLRIIENLVRIKLPRELFDESIQLLAKDSRSLAARILATESKIKFKGSSFLRFMVNYLLHVRGCLWNPNMIESEGQYAVTQIITGAMRVMASIQGGTEGKTAWSAEIRQELAQALLSLDTLTLCELDTMMCLLPSGEYEGVSAGDAAMTSKDETVIVLGYSTIWNQPDSMFKGKSDLSGYSSVLSQVRLTPEFVNGDQKVVALFYDKEAKSQQDLMLLNPASMSVLTHVDVDEAARHAENSPLKQEEIVKKLILSLGDESSQKKRQTASLILKILVAQIEAEGQTYLDFLRKIDNDAIFKKLMDYLQNDLREVGSVKSGNATNEVLPQKWLEAKIQRIRKIATETTQSLDVDEATQRESITTMLVENRKELVIKRENPRTTEQFLTNVFVTSAINIHRVPVGHPYASSSAAGFKASPSGGALKSGLVAFNFAEFSALSDKTLDILARSEAIIIGHETKDDLRGTFEALFKKVRDDFAKASHLRKGYMTISDNAFFFVQLEDLPDFDTQTDFKKGRVLDEKELRTPLEHTLALLEHWGGVRKDKALLHVDPQNLSNLPDVVKAIHDGLQADQKADEEYQVAVKEAEANVKDKAPLIALQKKLDEKIATEVKTLMEKKVAIKGILAGEALKKQATKLEDEKLTAFSTYQDDKTWWNDFESIGQKQLSKKLEQVPNDDNKKQKTEEAMTKQLWALLESVGAKDTGNLGVLHDKAISSMLSMQKKQCLLDLLCRSGDRLLPELIGTASAQRLTISFLKLQYSSAVLKKLQVGSKSDLKQIKNLMRRIFNYSINAEGHAGQFVKNFFENGCLKTGVRSVQEIRAEKASGVLDFYQNEDNALNGCNPYLLKFAVQWLLEEAENHDAAKAILNQENALSNVFGVHLCLVFLFQKDPVAKKLLKQAVKIVKYMITHEDVFLKSGELARIAGNKLVRAATLKTEWQFHSDSKIFSDSQLMFLELHLAISRMCDQISKIHGVSLGKVVEDSEDICNLKVLKQQLLDAESFDMLKYLMHYNSLEEREQKCLNIKLQTMEPTLKADCRAYVSIPEVQNVQVKADESGVKLGNFEYFGISNSPDGNDMSFKTAADREFTWNSNCFYMFYPVRRQQVISVGKCSTPIDRLTGNQVKDTPYSVFRTPTDTEESAFVPARVWSKNEYAVVQDVDGKWYEGGYIRCSHDTHEMKKIEKKVKSVHIGQNAVFIIAEDGKVWGKGECYDNLLPGGSDTNQWKDVNFHPDDAKKKEDIIDVSCCRILATFVNREGDLWLLGDTLKTVLGDLGYGDKPKKAPLPEKMKCRRAWAMAAPSDYDDVGIFAQLENTETGQKGIYVAGKGSTLGINKTEVNAFEEVKFGESDAQITQIETFGSKVVALDSEGQLWGWGRTEHCEFGVENPNGGYKTPSLLAAINSMGKVHRFKVSPSHMVVEIEGFDGEMKLYAVGRKQDSYIQHLGLMQDPASSDTYMHELVDFNGREVLDFACAFKNTIVVLGGPRKGVAEGLYRHDIGGGETSQGLLHFYKKDGKWQYVNAEEYETKKDTLPPLCLAIRCPIKDLESQEWPDLEELTKTMLDMKAQPEAGQIDTSGAAGVKHADVKCHATKEEIVGPRYHTRYTAQDQEVELNFSQAGMKNENEHSLTPQIFFRLTKPLLAGKELPPLDPARFYSAKANTKIVLEVVPDLRYMQNSELLRRTADAWKEAEDTFKKFNMKHRDELLAKLDEKVEQRVREHDISSIDIEDYFKVGEIEFKSEELQGYTDKVKMHIAKLYWRLSVGLFKAVSYRTAALAGVDGSFTQLIQDHRHLVLPSFKTKIIDQQIRNLPTGERGRIKIKRNPAKEFCDSGQCDHTGEFTIFGQIMQQCRRDPTLPDCFRKNGTDDQAYEVLLMGEGSQDVGGPFREMMSNVASELQSGALPLLVKTPNNRNDHGARRECWTINAAATTPTHADLYRLLGNFIGYAARTKSAMDFNFPPVIWKRLLGVQCDINDLKDFDKFTYQVLEETAENANMYKAEDFDAVMSETFQTYQSNQKLVELCPGGADKAVTHANHKEYIDLVVKTRLSEGEKQLGWIKEGINRIIPLDIFAFLSWTDLELRVCGPKEITVEALKAITENADSDEKQAKFFWQMFEAFTQEERKSYLKYVWGRSKIPADTSQLRYRHRLDISSHMDKTGFPIAHTCFFSVDVPPYETLEIMTEKFKYAMESCGEIDGDYGEQGIRPENSDDEGNGGGGYDSEE